MSDREEPFVRIKNLRRSFGDVHAVNGISFVIPRGQVLGFIGANGAGKTTTMRLLATLDLPDDGSITVDGIDAVDHPALLRARIGWMPDHTGTYQLTSVLDYLDFFARAYRMRGATRTNRLREVLEFTDLGPLVDRPMSGLSKGQSQRLALARTLLHDPALLILDEPAAGLDPKARIEFRNLVRLLRNQGKTLLISSHILSELGEMCDNLIFIDQGRIIHQGTPESLRRGGESGACVLIDVAGDIEPLLQWLASHPGWFLISTINHAARANFQSADPQSLSGELRRMVRDGIAVAEFRVEERRLEDAFVEFLKTPGETPALNPPPLPHP